MLGGIGNLNGAVLGGLLIGAHPGPQRRRAARARLDGRRPSVFTILILLMVFKPEGILGKPTTEKV